jgi:hypothetical protein
MFPTKDGGHGFIHTPSYTKKGTNKSIITIKLTVAHILINKSKCFKLIENGKKSSVNNAAIEAALDKAHDLLRNLYQTTDVYSDTLKLMRNYFKDNRNNRLFCDMIAFGLNPLTCNEDEVREFMLETEVKPGSITLNTLSKRISGIRQALFRIGREYSYGEGEAFECNGTTVNLGNPMTEAVGIHLRRRLEEIHSENGGPEKTTTITVADPTTGEVGEHSTKQGRLGLPTAVGTMIYGVMQHLGKGISLYERILKKEFSDYKRVENLMYQALLETLLIHEAGRPVAETAKEICHTSLSVLCHEQVPFLTFVFLEDATLAMLLKSPKALRWYKQAMFKGKKMQEHLNRIKSVVPLAHNCLDLLWTYIVVMRVVFRLNGARLTPDVFPKKTHNHSSYNSKDAKKLGFQSKTLYSPRYGSIEEERMLNVKRGVSKKRCGHTDKSKMDFRYALMNISSDSKLMRTTTTAEHVMVPMGVDDYEEEELGDLNADYEFNPEKTTATRLFPDWLKDTFEGQDPAMLEDFNATSRLVKIFLEYELPMEDGETRVGTLEERAKAKTALLQKLQRLELKGVPMGAHYSIPEAVLPGDKRSKHQEATAFLKSRFDDVAEPPVDANGDKSVPEIKFWVQMLYGNWGRPYNPAANSSSSIFEKKRGRAQENENEKEKEKEKEEDEKRVAAAPRDLSLVHKAQEAEEPEEPAKKKAKIAKKAAVKAVKAPVLEEGSLVGRQVIVPFSQWPGWKAGLGERMPHGGGFRGEVMQCNKSKCDVLVFSVHENGKAGAMTCEWSKKEVVSWLLPATNKMTQAEYTNCLFA